MDPQHELWPYLLLLDKRPCSARTTCASCPAHTMDVLSHVQRDVVRYYVGDRRQIHPPGNQVRADQPGRSQDQQTLSFQPGPDLQVDLALCKFPQQPLPLRGLHLARITSHHDLLLDPCFLEKLQQLDQARSALHRFGEYQSASYLVLRVMDQVDEVERLERRRKDEHLLG